MNKNNSISVNESRQVDGHVTSFKRITSTDNPFADLKGISIDKLTALQTGSESFSMLANLGILPSEIDGVSNDPNMNNAQLTALIAQLACELKFVMARLTRLERQMVQSDE